MMGYNMPETQHNTYQLLYIYSMPPDDGLQYAWNTTQHLPIVVYVQYASWWWATTCL